MYFNETSKTSAYFVIQSSIIIVVFYVTHYVHTLSSVSQNNVGTSGEYIFGILHPNMSVAHLLQGRYVSGNVYFEDESQLIPKWTNLTLFKIGQKFARENSGALAYSHALALIMDNIVPDIKHTLLATGTTATVEGAARRYTATAAQVYLWYENSIDDPQQKRAFFNSIQQVRRHHYNAAFKMLDKLKKKNFMEHYRKELILKLQRNKQSVFNDYRFWSAFVADLKFSRIPPHQRKYPQYSFTGIPITQFAHVLTQFSFIGLTILYRTKLGIIHVTDEELRGFIHFWGVTGHALGISDEFNICMPASLEESTKVFQEIMDELVIPSMFELDQTSHILLSTLLDGFYLLDPITSPGLMMHRYLRDICQINPRRVQHQLNIFEILNGAGLDALLSENLATNKWLSNAFTRFSRDLNGYKYFGANYSTVEKRSQRVFYT